MTPLPLSGRSPRFGGDGHAQGEARAWPRGGCAGQNRQREVGEHGDVAEIEQVLPREESTPGKASPCAGAGDRDGEA